MCDYCCRIVLRYARQSVPVGDVTVLMEEVTRTVSSDCHQGIVDSDSVEVTGGCMWSPLSRLRSLSREDLKLTRFLLFSVFCDGGYCLMLPVIDMEG